ncbi:HAD family hydrolase [Cellulosimicrobium arenosum]|uniref:HAD family hydrolase n=1 Tax=Cellulosimicrobium arenosum TaxID=2708133 RepID=A0A927G7H1_9MICO|nr:HAD family hydrolase [Cellulosimicrobium arenosum]MBD8077959.1 HAD family hydrolase [Cellulosimicrobium arenosum]
MIWLFDLDNTLVDRDEAFAAWARSAVAQAGGDAADVAAVVAADGGGHAPKSDVARVIVERLGWELDLPAVVERFRAGIVANVRAYPGVLDLLDSLRDAGDRVVVITNGISGQQRGKIARCAIEPHVDAIVVSGEEGIDKPDPRLVDVALERVGASDADRAGAWMLGDAAHLDVAVGLAAGTRTGWVSHGRTWHGVPGDADARPDAVAPTTCELVALVRAQECVTSTA